MAADQVPQPDAGEKLRDSTGAGCGEADAKLAEWTIVKASARLSVPVQRIVPDPPKGAVAMVVEVDGGQLFRRRQGKTQRIRYRDFVKPGDLIWLEGKGAAAIEFSRGAAAASWEIGPS